MVDPEDIAERFWNLAQKPSEEARRELLFLDDVMHKAHPEREIETRLEGVETALDVGAGTGRFSLWLAARGGEAKASEPNRSLAGGRARVGEKKGIP